MSQIQKDNKFYTCDKYIFEPILYVQPSYKHIVHTFVQLFLLLQNYLELSGGRDYVLAVSDTDPRPQLQNSGIDLGLSQNIQSRMQVSMRPISKAFKKDGDLVII